MKANKDSICHATYTLYLYAVQQLASATSSANAFRGSIDPKSMRAIKNSSLNNNEQKCASLQGTNDIFKDLL